MRGNVVVLICFLLSVFVLAVGSTRVESLKPGVYALKSESGSPLWELTIVKANENAKVYRVKGTIFGPIEAMNMEVVGTYDPESNKLKAKTLEIPGVGLKVLDINGYWEPVKSMLVVRTEGARAVELRYAGEAKTTDGQASNSPRTGGTYEGGRPRLEFILSPSSNPDQLTVIGRATEAQVVNLEIRGTYYVKRNALRAFGEIRGNEEALTITVDGKFSQGVFNVHYTLYGAINKKLIRDETFDCPYVGNPKLRPAPKKDKDPKKPTPEPSRGSLEGSLSTDRASAKIGETIKLNLSYNLRGRDDDVIQESVALYGPSGGVLARSDKERNMVAGRPSKRGFDIKCDKEGTYTVRVRVKGELSSEWKQETSFKIEPKKPKTDPNKAAGSYGLVDKKIGKAAPAEDNVGQGYRASGSVSEGALQISMTPLPGNFSAFDSSFTWTSPPSELKPGQVLDLTCTAKCSRSQKDPPGLDLTAWFRFSGLEVVEQAAANVRPLQHESSASATGKYKVRVPLNARGGDITITQGYTGWAWGSGGVWNPCVYTYRWGAKAIEGGKAGASGEEEETPAPQGTTLVLTTLDDKAQIRAKLDPDTITLNAGEPSKIVDISIAGFRTNTLDRVEVVFPQATDGWASLPGQIVVGGGAGSYDPANMGRPEHTDGYFFSARSTAPDSEQVIDIIIRQKDAGMAKLKLKVKVVAKPGRSSSTVKAWGGGWQAPAGHRWGVLTIYVNGSRLTGTFGDDGNSLLEGTINDRVFTFKYTDGDLTGTGQLTLSEKGDVMDGYYVREGETVQRGIKFTKLPDKNGR